MKYLLILLLCVGCTSLTNEEIITESKKCTDAGMGAMCFQNLTGGYYKVVCNPSRSITKTKEK